ncbi:hypothetical protein OV203_49065 [Nannocystis sp. ILAH1]|uniref:hypothetical protein n=1 Tax=Nannocystis sp. ILAH1 TaxID=2996789 RepID=UPI00226DBA96|nr:hypothetical protein [Nannocystis sp. ILAH1]MCY0995175.1 hypothetical protein [Nannocystis sp. ILAH1]
MTLLAACAPGKNDTDDDSSTSSSTSSASTADPTESTDATDPTDATESTESTDATGTTEPPSTTTSNPTEPPPETTGTTGSEADEFGFICVELAKAESEESDPFAGTDTIYLTLELDPCLNEFYQTHPEYVDGPEGTAVLEEWRGRLCSETVAPGLVSCEVDHFETNMGEGVPTQFTVAYKVLDAAQIDGRTLLWGPAPLAELAGCEPKARLTTPFGVQGFPENGGPLWSAQSWENPVGLVKSEANGCIKVHVAKQ